MNSSCSNASSVEQRLGVARPQQGEVAPADSDDFFDEILHARRRMPQSAHRPASPASTSRAAPASRSPPSHSCSPARRPGASPRARRRRSAPRRRSSATGPNVAARALRTGVARSVALVVPDITNPFFGRVLRGAQRAAQRRGLHGRPGRPRQRPRVGGGEPAGAARRPRRRPAAVRGRPPARRDRARDPDRDVPGPAAGRAARRRGGRRPRARPPVRARPHADRATSPRASTRRPSTSGATGCASGSGTRRRRRSRRSRSRAPPRRPGRCSTRAASPRSSATTTSSPAASTSPRASAASTIPGELSVVGFDDLDFARVLAPPLTTVAVDAEGLGAAAFEALRARLAGETVERRTGHARPARGPRVDRAAA